MSLYSTSPYLSSPSSTSKSSFPSNVQRIAEADQENVFDSPQKAQSVKILDHLQKNSVSPSAIKIRKSGDGYPQLYLNFKTKDDAQKCADELFKINVKRQDESKKVPDQLTDKQTKLPTGYTVVLTIPNLTAADTYFGKNINALFQAQSASTSNTSSTTLQSNAKRVETLFKEGRVLARAQNLKETEDMLVEGKQELDKQGGLRYKSTSLLPKAELFGMEMFGYEPFAITVDYSIFPKIAAKPTDPQIIGYYSSNAGTYGIYSRGSKEANSSAKSIDELASQISEKSKKQKNPITNSEVLCAGIPLNGIIGIIIRNINGFTDDKLKSLQTLLNKNKAGTNTPLKELLPVFYYDEAKNHKLVRIDVNQPHAKILSDIKNPSQITFSKEEPVLQDTSAKEDSFFENVSRFFSSNKPTPPASSSSNDVVIYNQRGHEIHMQSTSSLSSSGSKSVSAEDIYQTRAAQYHEGDKEKLNVLLEYVKKLPPSSQGGSASVYALISKLVHDEIGGIRMVRFGAEVDQIVTKIRASAQQKDIENSINNLHALLDVDSINYNLSKRDEGSLSSEAQAALLDPNMSFIIRRDLIVQSKNGSLNKQDIEQFVLGVIYIMYSEQNTKPDGFNDALPPSYQLSQARTDVTRFGAKLTKNERYQNHAESTKKLIDTKILVPASAGEPPSIVDPTGIQANCTNLMKYMA